MCVHTYRLRNSGSNAASVLIPDHVPDAEYRPRKYYGMLPPTDSIIASLQVNKCDFRSLVPPHLSCDSVLPCQPVHMEPHQLTWEM